MSSLAFSIVKGLKPPPRTLHRQSSRQPASLSKHSSIPAACGTTHRGTGDDSQSRKAVQILGINTSTIHQWLSDGFIAGEQITPGAPWHIRITDELRARFVEQAPPGYLPTLETTMKLGISRQTVLQRVKRGELEALLVTRGLRKGL
jgi:hypothetical protein